jgi:hypothetical protein
MKKTEYAPPKALLVKISARDIISVSMPAINLPEIPLE